MTATECERGRCRHTGTCAPRPAPRGHVATLALFAAVLTMLYAVSAWSEALVGLAWEGPAELRTIASRAARVRLVTHGKVLVELDADGLAAVRAQGMRPFLVHRSSGDGAYYLVSTVHGPLHAEAEPLYVDASGWVLLWLSPGDPAYALPHFLYPLPREYSIRGWTATPRRGKPVAALGGATMHTLLARVDEDRLRNDISRLTLLNPAGRSTLDNLRTRFTVHEQILESTEYIRSELAAVLGADAVSLEQFSVSRHRLSAHVRAELEDDIDLRAYNVVGELAGTDPDAGCYVICAHYDATGVRTNDWDWRTDPAPGADDNATGSALLLEAARVLSGERFPWSIRFVAFSGEELGLLGSRDYARRAAERDDAILGVLNFDMFGYNDLMDRVEVAANPASAWIADLMATTAARYDLGLRVDVRIDAAAGQSDHASFWARGYDGVLAIENYLPTDSTHYAVRQNLYRMNTSYHSVADVADSLNWGLVRKTTQLAVATLAQYVLEADMPNLAVATGDLRPAAGGMHLLVSNLGTGPVEQTFGVSVSLCGADSTGCQKVFTDEHSGLVHPGGAAAFAVPWERLGDAVFRIDVDPEDRIAEAAENDNQAYQHLYLQPRDRIVVYPNPFLAGEGRMAVFTGLPLKARVRIFAADGKLVWSAQEDGDRQRSLHPAQGEVWWLGVNSSARKDSFGRLDPPLVCPGVYLYVVSNADNELLRRGKIAVVR